MKLDIHFLFNSKLLLQNLFIAYLSQHHSLVVREIVIFYFLSQRRFVEAMVAHEELKLLAKVSTKWSYT